MSGTEGHGLEFTRKLARDIIEDLDHLSHYHGGSPRRWLRRVPARGGGHEWHCYEETTRTHGAETYTAADMIGTLESLEAATGKLADGLRSWLKEARAALDGDDRNTLAGEN